MQAPLTPIEATSEDAAISRFAASAEGYFNDPFASLFVKRHASKSPLINRGSFTRHSFFSAFQSSPDTQIISFGAGADTRYFNKSFEFKKYFEIDFPAVTARKISCIGKQDRLKSVIGEYTATKTDLNGHDYSIVSGDLTKFDPILQKLIEFGLDLALPTVFFSELTFVYIKPEATTRIIEFMESFNHSIFLSMDHINPTSPFGITMIRNLQDRGIDLPGLISFPTVQSHIDRFKVGWSVKVETLSEYFQTLDDERMLDEVEEWQLIGSHYAFLRATWKRE